jgi:hypothetical protein
MNATISILFYIKRAKVNINGICPIYVRITIDSKRLEFSSTKYVNIDQWSSEFSKVKGATIEARTINSHLDFLRNKIIGAEKILYKKDLPINTINIKNELFDIQERTRTIIPIFQDHNNKIKVLIGKEYAAGTLERYETSLKHTKDFLLWK